MALDDYFATGPPHERPVFEAVMGRLHGLVPIHVEAVSVGIFLKNPRRFVELRPRDHWVAVSFALDRRATHPTITRKVVAHGGAYWHTANVATPTDVDDALAGLLIEAYHRAAPNRAGR
jgi:hypothetical protein